MLMTRRTLAVRIGAVGLFLGLVLTVSAERRAAEVDFNDDFGERLENGDVVDGEELLGRLLLEDDVTMPAAPRQTAVISWMTLGVDRAMLQRPTDRRAHLALEEDARAPEGAVEEEGRAFRGVRDHSQIAMLSLPLHDVNPRRPSVFMLTVC